MRTLLITLSLFIVSLGSVPAQNSQPTGITVTGKGMVIVKPDRVKLQVSVEKKGQSAKEVKTATNKVMTDVLHFLKKENIPEKNYQTNYIRLDKKYDYDSKKHYYSAEQAITITLNNIKNYETIMSGLMEAGINRIDNVSFKDSHLQEHKAQARKTAAKDALKKAQNYAQVLGLKVGQAQMIQELNSNRPAPRPHIAFMKARVSNAPSANRPPQTLAAGQIKIIEKVRIRFSLMLD